MNRIDAVFQTRRGGGSGRAFIAYLTAGDPDQETSLRVMKTVADCCVDILEIGIPFSDPIADGPVIQAAFGRALDAGMNIARVLELVRELRKHSEMAVVLFTYYNPVMQYGIERFAKDAAEAGADGVLILDLPVETSEAERRMFEQQGLNWVVLVAPTTPVDRARRLANVARGFIYYVSREGVTGERASLAEGLSEKVRALKLLGDVPVCVGFGVSTVQHVEQVCAVADGVVIGSAIVRRIEQATKEGSKPEDVVRQFLQPLVAEAHRT